MSESNDLRAKIEAAKARRVHNQTTAAPATSAAPAQEAPVAWDPRLLLPDLGGPKISEAERELDDFVDKIDIIDAYNRWCRKMVPDAKGRRESIMISCPNPAHPDTNPSAWINLDKQTYYCGGCGEGGDAHDIAAYGMGLPVPGYKTGETFHKLRRDMAEAFGFRIKQVVGGTLAWIEHPPGVTPEVAPEIEAPNTATTADVVQGTIPPPATAIPPAPVVQQPPPTAAQAEHEDHEEEGDLVVYPTIDWKRIVPQDTFLWEYMTACTNDDAPEEYHFWHGLMALGLVCGRNVTLDDTQPVYGNLLVCILGATGTGKSRSRRHLAEVLKDVAPYKENGTSTQGVKQVPIPSSGEYLVHSFSYMGRDPVNPKITLGLQRVTGIVDFDEMAGLLARSNRQGSTMKPTIMQFADTVPDVRIGGLQRGDMLAFEPFCTITASTQPKAIRSLLSRTDTGSGFLNRWIFAGGKSKPTEVIGGERSKIRVDLTAAKEQLTYVRGWAGFERTLLLEDDAFELYSQFFRTSIEPAKTKDETDLLKRIDLITKKLMLLLTINLKADKVPKQVVEAVIVLFDYVVECYGILNNNIGVTQMQETITEILRHIERHTARTNRGASANDILRYTKRKNYGPEQIKKSLDIMTSLDLIELEAKGATVGRPTARYRVVGG